jgi:hemerythrin-like domain-containing protein
MNSTIGKEGTMTSSRRQFIAAGGMIVAGSAVLVNAMPAPLIAAARAAGEAVVTPNEDLMREHGLLNRVLLIYEDIAYRMKTRSEFPPDALNSAATIIKDFIEDYHEKLEEEYLFKRFEKANQLADLVKVLHQQHDGGRKLTDYLIHHSKAGDMKDPATEREIMRRIALFIRMYRPHEAREDTILFPAFKKLVSKNEYDSLGDDFEKEEKKKFGEDGFESVLHRVEAIEKSMGIYELAQFTPA